MLWEKYKGLCVVRVWYFSGIRSTAGILTSFFWFSLPLLLGIQISSFTQADLTSRNIQYIHSSKIEKHSDAFSFTLSDGVSEVGKALCALSKWVLIQHIFFDAKQLCKLYLPLLSPNHGGGL